MIAVLVVVGLTVVVAWGLLLVRADRALNEARDIRLHLLDDKRRAEDAQRRVELALRRLDGLADMVDRRRSQTEDAIDMARTILRAEHREALRRDPG